MIITFLSLHTAPFYRHNNLHLQTQRTELTHPLNLDEETSTDPIDFPLKELLLEIFHPSTVCCILLMFTAQVQPPAHRVTAWAIRWDGSSPDQSSSDLSSGLPTQREAQTWGLLQGVAENKENNEETWLSSHLHGYTHMLKLDDMEKHVDRWHPVVRRWFMLLDEEAGRRVHLQMVTAHHCHWSQHSSCSPES